MKGEITDKQWYAKLILKGVLPFISGFSRSLPFLHGLNNKILSSLSQFCKPVSPDYILPLMLQRIHSDSRERQYPIYHLGLHALGLTRSISSPQYTLTWQVETKRLPDRWWMALRIGIEDWQIKNSINKDVRDPKKWNKDLCALYSEIAPTSRLNLAIPIDHSFLRLWVAG